ncbi:dynein regulatory complex protein 1 isoform X2 [Macrosteles quadrilineatus]|uniref:dynein regulatory complex protein 1 isoform X2 n=1 Tax=Macrosteles quadrilineatus TaxID=74068 RepID=UPI0023E1DDA5|nr:dynein regulatory complex protein 1 isoform X2 [Macrosteles quadrilineatus]
MESFSKSEIVSNYHEEPQITSPDPDERIVARRLRIQKRNAAARKRLQAVEDKEEGLDDESKEETVLEKQVEKSTVELLTLAHEGRELITNVRVAADSHEVSRRSEQAEAKAARLKKLEDEANIAQEKFNNINEKWEGIAILNDPLDLHQETEMQREKCKDLISQKDQLIAELKAELKSGDVRFIKDQQKQAEDISLLVERIDSQIAIMRRAYRRELILIEQAIDIERKETMELNNKRWESLYKQREEDEINNLEQRFVALSEHNQLMQDILIHHQEKYRATKISLEKDIQVLQQQLEQVKAICLLNKEKMEYNYQVLKKRDEESLLIRSQQKRRINKLQDIVTTLRRKIQAMEQSTQVEVKRLTSEVIKLHRNIKDILMKAEHFSSVNEAKYFQLWKFNHDSAKKLLNKVLSIDRLIYEQQLGIEWQPPPTTFVAKKDLPSYKSAVMKDSTDKIEGEQLREEGSRGEEEQLLKHILESVADRSGFLVEERLNVLLAPYTREQNTLVRIDNVFSALGVSRQEDIELLRKTMKPYIVCVTCHPILKAVNPVFHPSTPPAPLISEDKLKVHVFEKVKEVHDEEKKTTTKERPTVKHGTVFPGVSDDILSRDFSQEDSFLEDLSEQTSSSRSGTHTSNMEEMEHDPSHEQSINPVFVLKALREFVEKFQASNQSKKKTTTIGQRKNERKSISQQLTEDDVKMYWEQFRSAFPPDRERLWDCLHLGMQQYHSVLQERHKMSSEIEQLRVQNADLRRLLQKYALPNNMKPIKGPRQSLPPLSAKTPPAPATTPAHLVLTFDNSSRL